MYTKKECYNGYANTRVNTRVIAELVRTAGARAEQHTLEYLLTHRAKKIWLSRDCPYVRPSVRASILKLTADQQVFRLDRGFKPGVLVVIRAGFFGSWLTRRKC